MSDKLIGEIANGDENRCGYTVHANGDWGDYRCELVNEHFGPHAIGLRHHAVPFVNALKAELETTQYGLAMTQHYWINPMEYEEDRAKWSKRAEALEARLSKMEEQNGWMKRVLRGMDKVSWMK